MGGTTQKRAPQEDGHLFRSTFEGGDQERPRDHAAYPWFGLYSTRTG